MIESDHSRTPPRLAVVISHFNSEVTSGLIAGTRAELAERGVPLADSAVYDAPGAFEIPLIAQSLAESGRYDGVVCLGCVIKGDTAHFEFISLGATIGLMTATLKTGVPVTFGILTTYDDAQAAARSRDDGHNKGREAAAACLQALTTLARVRAGA